MKLPKTNLFGHLLADPFYGQITSSYYKKKDLLESLYEFT